MPSNPLDKVLGSDDGRHMVELTCPNGHAHFYDKRDLCGAKRKIEREIWLPTQPKAAIRTDEVSATCPENGCRVKFVADVDCTGYR